MLKYFRDSLHSYQGKIPVRRPGILQGAGIALTLAGRSTDHALILRRSLSSFGPMADELFDLTLCSGKTSGI